MKTIGARELQQKLRETFDDARRESVIVTRHGKPIGLVVGFDENWDLEDVLYATSRKFWEMIAEARREHRGRRLSDVRARRKPPGGPDHGPEPRAGDAGS